MDRRALCLAPVALAAACYAGVVADEPKVTLPGLPGWHVENGKAEAWKVTPDGVVAVAAGGGFLTLDRQYGDFELQLEYRMPPNGNSGIGVHYPPGGHPANDGIEIQLLDDAAPKHANLKPAQYNGSIYMLVPPKARAAKLAPEWNQLALRCQGSRIQVRLNGVLIQDVDRDTQLTAPEGLAPLAKRPRRGSIGLQSYGDPVEFRKIEIREL